MKIAVVGGGPGGLYVALLTKKARPDWQVDVYEQNQADDTFGFGVVFSDETLEEFLSHDPPSYAAIKEAFAYWDDIIVRYRGQEIRCAGNGFAGCSRLALLKSCSGAATRSACACTTSRRSMISMPSGIAM
jgi:anthraniloyl-CoA monooxygenase